MSLGKLIDSGSTIRDKACGELKRKTGLSSETVEEMEKFVSSSVSARVCIHSGIEVIGSMMAKIAYSEDDSLTEQEVANAGWLLAQLADVLGYIETTNDDVVYHLNENKIRQCSVGESHESK